MYTNYIILGKFSEDPSGDKTVAFVFIDYRIPVLLEGKIMTLMEAVGYIIDRYPNICDLSTVLYGHEIVFDREESEIYIIPDYYGENYYTPILSNLDNNDNNDVSVKNYGMFANDLAYHPSCDKHSYQSNIDKNILAVVWEVEIIEDGDRSKPVITPVSPFLMLRNDVILKNKSPMEIGLAYSWRYWEAFRNNSAYLKANLTV